jgi:hypothetical protein
MIFSAIQKRPVDDISSPIHDFFDDRKSCVNSIFQPSKNVM